MTDVVDWDLARSLAATIGGKKPFATPETWGSAEADFAEFTPLAEERVANETGLESANGKARSKVVDRGAWVDANISSFDRLMRPLFDRLDDDIEPSWFDRISAPVTEFVGPKFAGGEVGAMLGWMSGRVLGQYDLLIIEDERPEDQDWVYYVAPNILSLEDRYAFSPRQFRLWIAVHECTHRAQFTGVPWLRPYFLSLVNSLLDNVDADSAAVGETIKQALEAKRNGTTLKDGGLAAFFASGEQKETLDKVTGLMSLLEGHGDVTMDRAAADLLPSQGRFRRIMSARRKNPNPLAKVIQRVTGMEAKLAQYEEGESFITAVEAVGGRELFDLVWHSEETLPTIEEIREPQRWIDRVGT